MSMANSLEVRSPLLDYRVAEYAFSLSGKLKIRGNQLKYILKKAYQADLPRELRNRPKQGFEVPIGQWFRRDPKFRKLFWGVVNPGDLEKQQILRWEKIQSLYEEHERNRRDNSHKLWAILVFQWWYQNQ
jgi:asparagine synthase (glutamine-hydrolysing)